MRSSEDMDPFAELREEAELELELKLEPAAPAAPPPLPPPRRASAVAPRPAMTLPAVRVPSRTSPRVEETELAPDGADPFAEPPEPAAPPESALKERLEHLRAVVRQKGETLRRARALYAERESELRTARIAETTLRGQWVETQGQLGALKVRLAQKESGAGLSREAARAGVAESRVAQLEAELAQVEADRQDLSRSLADVEAELTRMSSELTRERESRGSLAEELIGAKEALSLAQDRVSELVAEHIETQGALESVRDQYQSTLADLEATEERLGEAQRERELVAAERTGLQARVAQLESMLAESEWSSSSLDEVRARLVQLEAERDGAQAESGELVSRLELAETEVERLRERMESDAAALGEVAEQAEANVARLEKELGAVTEELAALRAAAPEAGGEHEESLVDSLEMEEMDGDQRAVEAEAEAERLRQRVKMLEGALKGGRDKVSVLETEAVAERDRLREDVAAMKRKLMAAEQSLESAASYKMKVARLEAELARWRQAK